MELGQVGIIEVEPILLLGGFRGHLWGICLL
jgi:hypothetical protein